MAKNRYGEQHRLVKGRLKVMEAINRKLYRVEIWALNDKPNRNGWQYINLDSHLEEFKDIPILTAYLPNGKIGDGHNFDMKRDPMTGEEYASFTAPDAERIVGWVPKDASIRIEAEGDTRWVVVQGYLWTWYARELVEKIARQGSGMEVSIETLVTKEHKEGNVDVEEEYVVLGITVLGDGVAPAVAGANIQTLAMLRSSMEKEVLKAASYAQEPTKNKKIRGVKVMGAFNKKQIDDLNGRFEGYKVLAAFQNDAGIHVCLMADDGATAVYTMDSVEHTIVPEKIRKVNAQVEFAFDGDVVVKVDACELTESFAEKAKAAETSVSALSKSLSEAENTIKSMEAIEQKRRLEAAKTAAKSTLEKYNATSEHKVDEKALNELMADIDKGVYANCVDAEGMWNGDAKVKSMALAACAAETMARNEEEAKKKANTFIWDKATGKKAEEHDDSVDGLLSKLGIR